MSDVACKPHVVSSTGCVQGRGKLPPFQYLLDSYGPDVWRFLAASVQANDVEDCFQETFIAALKAYPRLRASSNLRGWILTIAHRKAIDVHRARARRATPVADIVDASDRVGQKSGAGADALFPVFRDEALWKAVSGLPARQRSAVMLRFVADLQHDQIAAAIGCSEQAARRSLHEGLTKLRGVAKS